MERRCSGRSWSWLCQGCHGQHQCDALCHPHACCISWRQCKSDIHSCLRFILASFQFLIDRVCQSVELCDFIHWTVDHDPEVDLVILAGDFNSNPGELPHNILYNSFTDCWQVLMKKIVCLLNFVLLKDKHQLTYGNPQNTFSGISGDMETLDYVFIRFHSIFPKKMKNVDL